jgi:hypothetical protein
MPALPVFVKNFRFRIPNELTEIVHAADVVNTILSCSTRLQLGFARTTAVPIMQSRLTSFSS